MSKAVIYVSRRMKVIRGWSSSDLLLNVDFVAQFSRERIQFLCRRSNINSVFLAFCSKIAKGWEEKQNENEL